MTQFNYVTSDGKFLKIDSEKLSDENKNKLSDQSFNFKKIYF